MVHIYCGFGSGSRFRTGKSSASYSNKRGRKEEINQILPVVNVLPITSRKQNRRIYPNEVLIPKGSGRLERESIVLCYQIRTLDKKRLTKEIGEIDKLELQEAITNSLCFQLGII